MGRIGLLLMTLAFASASLAAQRTFVASTGLDANPCSIGAPCRSFGAAISHTDSDGEIIVLDSAGYGPVTIIQSVSIIAPPGVYAGISVFSGDGVTIDAPLATVSSCEDCRSMVRVVDDGIVRGGHRGEHRIMRRVRVGYVRRAHRRSGRGTDRELDRSLQRRFRHHFHGGHDEAGRRRSRSPNATAARACISIRVSPASFAARASSPTVGRDHCS